MIETTEKAILAGDCFWGMQDLLRKRPDVISTRVGYTGGDVPNATYRHHGTHAEAIEIVFDPQQISHGRVYRLGPTQLTLLRLGDLDRLTSHDPNVRRGYDNSSSPRRTYFREPVLVDEHVSPTRKEPRQSARSELMATFVEQVRRGTAQHQVEFQLSVSMGARWPVGRR